MKRWRAVAVVLGTSMLVVGSHLRAVHETPLVRYGYRGAEYLEHLQRQDALALTTGLSGWDRLRSLPDHLALLDGQYPALLHVLEAAWAAVAGDSIEASLWLNVVFLGLIAVAAAWLARGMDRLAGPAGPTEPMAAAMASPAKPPDTELTGDQPARPTEPMGAATASPAEPPRDGLTGDGWRAPALAAAAVLLVPAVFVTARRYYYDLPLAAFCALATAALLRTPTSSAAALLAAAATAAACLTKWQALLYLAPAWILALVLGARSGAPSRPRALLRLAAAAAGAVFLCWPVARRSDRLAAAVLSIHPGLAAWLELSLQDRRGSLDDALGQGRALAGADAVLERLVFYGRALIESSVGPLVAGALLLCALVGWRGGRALGVGLWLTMPPVLVLSARVAVQDERFVLPLIAPLVASIAAAWGRAATPRTASIAAAGGHEATPQIASIAAAGGCEATPQAESIAAAGRRAATPRTAQVAALLLLGAGSIQLLSVDDLLPRALGPRPPVQHRGWNRRHEAPPSPWDRYLAAAAMACAPARPSAVYLEPPPNGPANELHAWRWAFGRACPGIEVRTLVRELPTSTDPVSIRYAQGRFDPRTDLAVPLAAGERLDAGDPARCEAYLVAAGPSTPAAPPVFDIPGGNPARVFLLFTVGCPGTAVPDLPHRLEPPPRPAPPFRPVDDTAVP